MPEALITKLKAARTFNQGFATVEYVASALVDLDFHELASAENLDVAKVREGRARAYRHAGRNRHAPPLAALHPRVLRAAILGLLQLHVSEVMDADAFDAFTETGDAFDPARQRNCTITSTLPATGAIRAMPTPHSAAGCRQPDALLKKRGLSDAA